MNRRTERTFNEWWEGEMKAIAERARRDLVTFSCAVVVVTAVVVLGMMIAPYWAWRMGW